MKYSKRFVSTWGLLVFSSLISIGLAEATVRLFDINFDGGPFWYFHPVLGWTQKPGTGYDYVVSGEQVRVQYNSLGFRDVEHSLTKPEGVKRIVLIGDSYCEAVEVNLEDTFFRRLQDMLNRDSKHQWEVINLGVGDFGTAQAYLALANYGLDYSPDLVLHQIFPLNDICNNSVQLFNLCKSPNDPLRPYFVESDGGLELTYAQPIRNILRRRLAIYRLFERVWLSYWSNPDETERERERVQLQERLGLPPLDPLLYTFVRDDEMIEPVATGWRITELILTKIAALTRQEGIPLMFVVVPFEARIGPGWKGFVSDKPPPKMIQDYPEKRLSRLFEGLDIPFVLLKPLLEAHTDLVFPSRGGHLNPEAHQITAEAIYEKLRRTELIQ